MRPSGYRELSIFLQVECRLGKKKRLRNVLLKGQWNQHRDHQVYQMTKVTIIGKVSFFTYNGALTFNNPLKIVTIRYCLIPTGMAIMKKKS